MKLRNSTFMILLFLLLINNETRGQDQNRRFFIDANRFFNKYVFEGRVDYHAIRNHPGMLDKLVKEAEKLEINDAKPDTRKAFWINTYNLLVIKQVIKYYPLESVNRVQGFFDDRIIKIGGEELSLNEIEEKKLKELFKDGRYIFLLCKARHGQPRLINQGCTPDMISTLLIDQIISVINDTAYVKTDNDGFWQMADFFEPHRSELEMIAGSLQMFINKYRKIPVGPDYLLTFFKSDDRLNDDDRYTIHSMSAEMSDSTRENARNGKGFYFEADDGRLADFKMQPWRQAEIVLNNNFSTFKEAYNKQMARNTLRYSYASNTTKLQLFYGAGRKTTVGLSLSGESVRLAGTFTSPASIYEFNKDTNAACYVHSISPILRLNIAEGFFHLRMQHIFNCPVTKVSPLRYNGVKVSEENPFILNSQFYVFKYFSEYVRTGLEADVAVRFSKQFSTFTITPRIYLNTVFSIPLNRVFRIYGLIEASPGSNTSEVRSYYFKEGTGIRSRVGISEVTLYYSYIFLGKSTNATNSLVLNVRIGI